MATSKKPLLPRARTIADEPTRLAVDQLERYVAGPGGLSSQTTQLDQTKVGLATNIFTTLPLMGGGSLTSDLTLAVNTFGSSGPGVVPASGGGTVNYLRADVTWANPVAGYSSGTGTPNTLAKFTGSGNTIGNGWATDDGTTWGVTGRLTITEATGATAFRGTTGTTLVSVIDGHTAQATSVLESLIDTTGATMLGSGGGGSGGPPAYGGGGGAPALPTCTGIVVNTIPTWTGSGNNIAIYANAQNATNNYAFFAPHGDVYLTAGNMTMVSGDLNVQNGAFFANHNAISTSGSGNFLGGDWSVFGRETIDPQQHTAGQIAGLELVVGRDSTGSSVTGTDVAFQYCNGAGGGYRHWISTQHDTAAATNKMRFWVNTSATAGGSSAPGTGNTEVLRLAGDGAVTVLGTLAVNGNTTLGDATSDTVTITGQTTATAAPSNNTAVITAQITATGQTATQYAMQALDSGTYDTTSGLLEAHGVIASVTATRSAGANSLVNNALYGNASGGQINRALYTDNGDVVFNAVSGSTTAARDFAVSGNTTLGAATSNTTTINGATTVNAPAGQVSPLGLKVLSNQTAQTANKQSIYSSAQGTFDTTAGAIQNYATYSEAVATRSAGANNLQNYGGFFDATGGQLNIALETYRGDVQLNANSGTTTIYGTTAINALTTITANPTSTGGAELLVTNSTTGQTVSNYCINATELGSYNCTSAALQAFAVNAQVNATRSAGANNLTCTAIFADAQNGQVNKALVTDHGDVILNNTNGTTLIKGNIGFYGTTPIAKPAPTGSRGGNAALASLLTALANLGLITDSTSP
jgi:hypothetical protein